MAEVSFPFNSIGGDRRYKAEEFRQYFALLFCNGIFYKSADALKVVQGEGMTVQLNTGAAWADGCGYINTTPLSFTLDTADGALNRIDRIVLRCDYKERKYYAAVKKGTYSAQPTAPSIQRDADAYEQAVADIYVGKGTISITQANITDTRLNTELCGIVTGTVQQADTTEIFNQFEAYFEEFKQKYYDMYAGQQAAAPQETTPELPFKVRVDIDDLNIRTGAGTNYAKTGEKTGRGVFTVTEVRAGKGADAGWGKLKSGAGWVSLDYCEIFK